MKKHPGTKTPVQLISYRTLRQMLGILGIAMPILVWAGSQLAGPTELKGSISAYWFTNSRDIFVGILVAYAVFLISYRAYARIDNQITNGAGVLALIIAFFPALAEGDSASPWLFALLDSASTSMIHYISAATFFVALSVISFFLFTRSGSKKPSRRKLQRNVVYRACGLVIFLSIACIGIFMALPDETRLALAPWHPVFMLESLALTAFGISWLLKGETFLRDQ